MQTYLFVLCPPYSGSTVLWKILGTSPHVSMLRREGQFLEEVSNVMRDSPYDTSKEMPWKTIRAEWELQWDQSKAIALEKSPPNLVRAFEIQQEFKPCHFISMIRNPYASCEGIIRRGHKTLVDTTNFWISCAQHQKNNIETLNHIIHFSYEELVSDPTLIKQKILRFMPELEALDFDIRPRSHSVFGVQYRKITNMNKPKINNLKNEELTVMNSILDKHKELLDYFGYELIKPNFKRHITRHMKNPLTRFNIGTQVNRKLNSVRKLLCK